MRIDELDYDLPEALIAQEPPRVRGTSRLLVLDRTSGAISHHAIADELGLDLPTTKLVQKLLGELVAAGHGEEDHGGLVQAAEKLNDIVIE